MTKTAIFVEGQTELIFVREYLLQLFEYQDIAIACYTLFVDTKFNPTEYAVENLSAAHFFQILNVGNDNAVLSRILNREKYLWNSGFDKIIGLRDMYSRAYRDANPKSNKIDSQINAEFIKNSQIQLSKKAEKPENINFQYAIMEAESWILALNDCFTQLNPMLTNDFIREKLGYDLAITDPETAFYHPAEEVEKIYHLAKMNYNKSKSDIYAIMSTTNKDSFMALFNSQKCESFKAFQRNFV